MCATHLGSPVQCTPWHRACEAGCRCGCGWLWRGDAGAARAPRHLFTSRCAYVCVCCACVWGVSRGAWRSRVATMCVHVCAHVRLRVVVCRDVVHAPVLPRVRMLYATAFGGSRRTNAVSLWHVCSDRCGRPGRQRCTSTSTHAPALRSRILLRAGMSGVRVRRGRFRNGPLHDVARATVAQHVAFVVEGHRMW